MENPPFKTSREVLRTVLTLLCILATTTTTTTTGNFRKEYSKKSVFFRVFSTPGGWDFRDFPGRNPVGLLGNVRDEILSSCIGIVIKQL